MKKKQEEWEAQAIRTLFHLEMAAEHLRAQLEHGDVYLADLEHQASDLNSHVMTFITLVDRSAGIAAAGL